MSEMKSDIKWSTLIGKTVKAEMVDGEIVVGLVQLHGIRYMVSGPKLKYYSENNVKSVSLFTEESE